MPLAPRRAAVSATSHRGHGLTHLQVGEVTQTDDETITADIVTQEGSLALRLEIDAYTGFVKSVS